MYAKNGTDDFGLLLDDIHMHLRLTYTFGAGVTLHKQQIAEYGCNK